MLNLFEQVERLVKQAHLEELAWEELEKRAEDDGLIGKIRKKRRKYFYLDGERLKADEARNIEKAYKKTLARTPTERRVERLSGMKPTEGQLTRWGLLGAGAGAATHLLGSAIEGGKPWLPKGGLKGALKPSTAVLAPRNLARAGAVGATFAAGVPIARKLWDIQTARENPEAF